MVLLLGMELRLLLPKLYIAGSGCHLHLSLWRDGQNLLPDANGTGNLSEIARAFAGLLST